MESKRNHKEQREGGLPGKNLSLRLGQLDNEFIRRGGKFETRKAAELFTVSANPQLDKSDFSFSPDSTYPYFTRTVFNNGILGKVDYLDEEHLIKGNTLAVGMMAMKFFYMSHDFYAGQFTKCIIPKFDDFDELVALWFIAWFNKSSRRYLSVLVRNFEKEFLDTDLVVPIRDGQIDTEFIRSRIRELEESRIRELEAYLSEAGFDDCTLTPEEESALSEFKTGDWIMSEFSIGQLFNVDNGDVDIQNKDINGAGEYFINSGVTNFGIKGRTNRPAKIFPANTLTIDFFGNVYYRPFRYKLATHNHVFSYSGESIISERMGLFYMGALSYLTNKYSFNRMATKKSLSTETIWLPVKANGMIDYDKAESLIRALQKQVISQLRTNFIREHKLYLKAASGK